MSDLEALHVQAKKLVLVIKGGLERLEASEQNSRALVPQGLATELQRQLQQLQRLGSELDAAWRMHSLRESGARRDLWKRKVEQVAEDTDALRADLRRYGTRQHRRAAEEAQRAELMERRGGGGTLLDVDAEAAARRSVGASRRVAEEAYQAGVGVLADMAGQRERLKATHRKVLDVLNKVGLSDSLLRLIERRQRLDKVLAYGGMAATLLLVGGLYYWFKIRR